MSGNKMFTNEQRQNQVTEVSLLFPEM